jgi:NADH dehydrogenase FAD-containing subunit
MRVVVVGGGYGGATAARYLARSSTVEVTLVEREAAFVSCPLSNLVLAGSRAMADITLGYEALAAMLAQPGKGGRKSPDGQFQLSHLN